MGELQTTGHIANRIDPPVAAAQPRVHLYPTSIKGYSSGFQIEPLYIDLAAHGHQKMRPMKLTT